MRILLVKPPLDEKLYPCGELFLYEPLELEYVGAGVSDKHEVRILDLRLDKSLEKHLAEYAPDVVGLTSYVPQVYITIDLCKKIKAFNSDIFTVVGGHHATIAPQDFCDPAIDIIVMGEGVFTFRDIVERLEENHDVTDVKGISFYANGQLKFTPPRDIPDLDSFPFPDRSLTLSYRQNYFSEPSIGVFKPLATIRTSKGCPFRCNFCSQWKVTKGKYLTRNPYSIFEELKTIKEPFVDFADDETFIDVERMEKLADLIIESGMKKIFTASVRSDTVIKHPGLFEKWKRAGMKGVLIGAESNRPEVLEYFKKKNTTSNNEEAISLLKKIGMRIDASFIVPPDYDLEDFDNLANYIKGLEVDFVMCIPLTPLPGTDLYEELKDRLTTTDLEFFDLSHMVLPTKLPLKKFYRELAYLIYRTNKVLGENYEQSHVQKFMTFYKELRNRYLHHQTQ